MTSRGENRYSLVTTKLYVPRLRPYVVSRPRLLEKLGEIKNRKLALISAPAGFGKTTLLSDWINQSLISAAWISLDSEDNDHVHFPVYMISAIQGLSKNVGQAATVMLQTPQPPPVETVLNDLCLSAVRSLVRFLHTVTGLELMPVGVAVIQTFGDRINFHPHIHVLMTEGGTAPDGVFHRVSRFHDELIQEIFTHEEIGEYF